jgi:hypothetical protein
VTPLAHAGGIDELLFTVVPVLVFVLVFRLARGKRDREHDEESRPAAGRPEPRPR